MRPFAIALLLAIAPLSSANRVAAQPKGQPVDAQQSEAGRTFAQLATLVGTWRNADKPASSLRIHFYLTAGGTVLVESWVVGGKPHSLTVYHREEQRVIATHYCPQGNQPRLALQPGSRRFKFLDATDLDPGESHLAELGFDLTNTARPVRSEVYRAGTEASPSTLVLTRE